MVQIYSGDYTYVIGVGSGEGDDGIERDCYREGAEETHLDGLETWKFVLKKNSKSRSWRTKDTCGYVHLTYIRSRCRIQSSQAMQAGLLDQRRKYREC